MLEAHSCEYDVIWMLSISYHLVLLTFTFVFASFFYSHCMTCPLTFCFDCSPDEYTEGGPSPAALALTKRLEWKNMSVKNMLFFTCRDCKTRNDKYESSLLSKPAVVQAYKIGTKVTKEFFDDTLGKMRPFAGRVQSFGE